jgi:hypothetical protein
VAEKTLKATVLFLNFNKHGNHDLHGSKTDSVKSTYLEMHTLYRYEKAQGCNENEGTLPVNVNTAQNIIHIKRSDIFRNYYNKNFQKFQFIVYVFTDRPFVNSPKCF